jgi:hypothetical protein
LVAALAPGLFLNEIYTWPKAPTAYLVLVAFALGLRKRALGAGAFAALAYLCHPTGAFWIPSVAAVLLSTRGGRAWGELGRFAGAAAIVVVPWQIFTSAYMHAFSKELFWPLGAVIDTRTNLSAALSEAWGQFTQRGLAGNVWVRVESTASSLFPVDLSGPGAGNGMPHLLDAKLYWARAHGFSLWGMLGLFLFPATILFLVRHWPRDRTVLLSAVAPYLLVVILATGFPDTWSSQSGYPLVGLLAVFSGEMLLSASVRTRWVLWTAMAVELLTTAYVCEYSPYNAPTATLVVFGLVGIGAHLALILWLARALHLQPPRRFRRHARVLAAPSAR